MPVTLKQLAARARVHPSTISRVANNDPSLRIAPATRTRIKTLLREWAYRFAYPSSGHRARALGGYLRWYNARHPHSSIGGKPPISRVADLCGHYN